MSARLEEQVLQNQASIQTLIDNALTLDLLPSLSVSLVDNDLFMVRLDATGQTVNCTLAQLKDSISFSTIQLGITGSAPAWSEGLLFYDNVNDTLALYNSESEITQQLGQEVFMRVYNESGSDILDGKAVSVVGVDVDGVPKIDLAIATNTDLARNFVGCSTHTIEDGTFGFVTTRGFVNGIDTSSFSAGALLYLSDTVAGGFTETRPNSPSYEVKVGGVSKVNATTGIIYVEPLVLNNTQGTIAFFNGCILEPHTVGVTSNGTTITLTLDDTGSTLNLFFNGEFTEISVPATIALTPGTDIAPVINYVYIPESTKVLTKSTSGFPTGQYAQIATVVCQSAASIQTDGAYKVHAWTNHIDNGSNQGHLVEVNEWIRSQHATYLSGGALTLSAAEGVPTANIDVSTTAGVALQLHQHTYPAFTTVASADSIYIINDADTKYLEITSLNTTDLNEDSEGVSLVNRWFTAVLWVVVSEDEADCKLMLNLPSGSYAGSSDAIADPLKYRNTTIPQDYKGCDILLAAITMQNKTGNIEIATGGVQDLRGFSPLTSAGSGTGVSITEFSDGVFKIFAAGDPTKEIIFDASAIGTGQTRTIEVPNENVNLSKVDTKSFTLFHTANGTALSLATPWGVEEPFVIGSDMEGWELVEVTVQTRIAGTGIGTTGVTIYKDTGGTLIEMLSSDVTLATGVYSASNGVINTAVDDVSQGDIILCNLTSLISTPPEGLAVNCEFKAPSTV